MVGEWLAVQRLGQQVRGHLSGAKVDNIEDAELMKLSGICDFRQDVL
jgi:hypothetical protein